jgi:hypothetical protein
MRYAEIESHEKNGPGVSSAAMAGKSGITTPPTINTNLPMK